MSSGSTNTTPPSPVSGISLVIEGGENESQTLDFQKARSRVISIGRKSGQAKGVFATEDDKALFKCPVISRRHAKITFTEYGNVYITDLGSHHGTHLLKPGDAVSRMITPEVPNFLSDGDVITFGKTVGKDQTLVRPVSVRVKLQCTPNPNPPPTPTTPVHDVTVISDSSDESSPSPKPSSGRYGVFLPSSSHSSSSDGESDMELSPPPPDKSQKRTACIPPSRILPPSRLLGSFLASSQTRTLPRIITAPSPSITPPPLNTGRAWEEDAEFDMELEDGQSDVDSPSFSPIAPPPPSMGGDLLHGLIGAWPIPPPFEPLFELPRFVPRLHPGNNPFGHPMMGGFGFDEARQYPMPGPQLQMPQAVVPVIQEIETPDGLDEDRSSPVVSEVSTPPVSGIAADFHPNEEEVVPQLQARLHNVPIVVSIPSIEDNQDEEEDHDTPSTEDDSNDVSLETSTDEVSNPGLIINRPGVADQTTKLDLTVLDETHTQDHISIIATSAEICTAIEPKENETTADPTIEALRSQMEEEMTAIKSARAEVEELVSELKARIQAVRSSPTCVISSGSTDSAQTSTSTIAAHSSSLKRKRDDVDDVEEEEQAPTTITATPTQVVSDTGILESADPAPKRRRTTKVLSAVAQTTAIATVGALAAWSVLAFT